MAAKHTLAMLLFLLLLNSQVSAQFASFTVPIGPGFGDPRFIWTYDTRVIYSPVTSVSTVTSSFATFISWTRLATVTAPTSQSTTVSLISTIHSSFYPVLTAFAVIPVTADASPISHSLSWIFGLGILGALCLSI
jgi:hypothetical protein